MFPENSSHQVLSETSTGPGCLVSPESPAVFRSPEPGAWYDPSNWSPGGDTPVPHTDQVTRVYISNFTNWKIDFLKSKFPPKNRNLVIK